MPVASAAAMFSAYTLGMGHELSAPKAFACLAWLMIVMRAFIMIPRGSIAVSEGER